MPINPLFCGAWDGCHLWLQWDDAGLDSYDVEIAYCEGERRRKHKLTAKRPWLHVPLHHATGNVITAAVNGEAAREVTMLRPRCNFEWKAGTLSVNHVKGVAVAFRVDGAVCAYKLLESVDIQPGESCVMEMEAIHASPWSQLDRADHFVVNLPGGGLVRNTGPSIKDYRMSGRAFCTRLKAMKPGPFILIKTSSAKAL